VAVGVRVFTGTEFFNLVYAANADSPWLVVFMKMFTSSFHSPPGGEKVEDIVNKMILEFVSFKIPNLPENLGLGLPLVETDEFTSVLLNPIVLFKVETLLTVSWPLPCTSAFLHEAHLLIVLPQRHLIDEANGVAKGAANVAKGLVEKKGEEIDFKIQGLTQELAKKMASLDGAISDLKGSLDETIKKVLSSVKAPPPDVCLFFCLLLHRMRLLTFLGVCGSRSTPRRFPFREMAT